MLLPQLAPAAAGPLSRGKITPPRPRYRAAKRTPGTSCAPFDRLRDVEPRRAAALALAAAKPADRASSARPRSIIAPDLRSGDEHWSRAPRVAARRERPARLPPQEIGQVLRGARVLRNLLSAAAPPAPRNPLEMNAAPDAANAAAQQPLPFSPSPRVLLLDDLPADVAAQIASYQTKKSKLKKDFTTVARLRVAVPGLPAAQSAEGPSPRRRSARRRRRRGIRRGPRATHRSATLAERSPLPPVLPVRPRPSCPPYRLGAEERDRGA